MQPTDELLRRIKNELDAARVAMAGGNDGRARACCRRAVGLMLSYVRPDWTGQSSVERLRMLAQDSQYPDSIRRAAERLQTSVRHRLTPEFSFNPPVDAQLILRHFFPESASL